MPWLVEEPRAPEIVDSDTLAMVLSSTATKLAAAIINAATISMGPDSGGNAMSLT
ncbi:hypothetical protein LMG28614_07284 [Paraburkholderia ultramafica]|uniref:Uncharacterized protein n=1 Tax=Paraburkholderia ultramafica TaxID=1544867 RepID=A0A6S7C4F5_9BURK|nr:hypothetical protein LMG28614_07284 [Paraburkholderia ultramafica]